MFARFLQFPWYRVLTSCKDPYLFRKKSLKKRLHGKKILPHEGLTGDLVFVDDPRYPLARQDFIKLYQSYPYVICFVQRKRDVQTALAWAKRHNVSVRIRSGRNSTEGWSNINNGIVIDVSQLKQIDIDIKNRVVHVGAGVTQGELTNALSSTGFFTALGNEGILGLVGVVLGGGIGLLSRNKGPGCDSIMEMTTVLADGQIILANAHKHRDLFWASRGGGGGNFGVVTSFDMKLYKAPKLVVAWQGIWPVTSFFDVFDTWQRWAPYSPDSRLSSNISVFRKQIVIKGIFLGSSKELGNQLEPIQSVPNSTSFTITEQPFSQWFVSVPGSEQPFQKYSPMWVHRPFGRLALQSVYNQMLKAPSDESNFFALA